MTLILNLEPSDYSPKARAVLDALGTVENGPMTREQLLKTIGKYDVVITRLGHKIDREALTAASKLKAIVTATTGLNHVDTEEAEKRGITVLCLRGEREFLDSISATAEHTMALIFALIRQLPASHADVVAGNWDRDSFKGIELNGRTLGVIGYGRLGSKVARYAKAFGMKVLANDILPLKPEPGIEAVTLAALLERSDIVSLHVLYTPETHGLIAADQFAAMKPGALFINTARGEIVDEAALLKALKTGHLGGAGLDVLCGENGADKNWRATDPLIAYAGGHKNLIITPHTGGATYDSMEKTEIFMAKKLERFFNGKEAVA